MKQIYCYKHSTPLTLLAVIDDFESFSFERSYSGIGSWQLTLDGTTLNAERIAGMDYIAMGSGVAGLVSKIKTENVDDRKVMTITGVELKGLADFRIIMPPIGQSHLAITGSPEYIMKELLRTQITEAGATRAITNVLLAPYTPIHSNISKEYRFQSLTEKIQELAATYSIGWYADIIDGGIVFHIYNGANRTESQSDNDKLIVSYERDSLLSSDYSMNLHIPATALVAGQGEGIDRDVVIVGDDKVGLDRKEIYVDARDLADNTLLPARGEEKLAGYSSDEVYDIALGQQMINQYRINYELGDIGTVIDDVLPTGKADFYLTTVEEVYEDDDFRINVVFGYDKATLSYAISRINANTEALLNTEGSGELTPEDLPPIPADKLPTIPVSKGGTGQTTLNAIGLLAYPIGAIYQSLINTSPATLFGGTWAAIGAGTFLVAAGSGYEVGTTGGAATHAHTTPIHTHTTGSVGLSIANLPSHNHPVRTISTATAGGYASVEGSWKAGYGWDSAFSQYTGGGTAHNHGATGDASPTTNAASTLPPYYAVYIWRRTA